jgi:hypothetical protein
VCSQDTAAPCPPQEVQAVTVLDGLCHQTVPLMLAQGRGQGISVRLVPPGPGACPSTLLSSCAATMATAQLQTSQPGES